MLRRLILALATLVLLRADMYQDASNAKQPEAAQNLGVAYNPLHYGAVMDGASHPLSEKHTTLASAQAVCPSATSLAQERDWCAMQALLDLAKTVPDVGTDNAGLSYGLEIRIPPGTKLNTGTTPLKSNLASVTISGDEGTSTILVSAPWWLEFGLDNRMGPEVVRVSGSGTGFEIGDTLAFTGGTCSTQPVVTVIDLTDGGGINALAITTPGSCSVVPPNPMTYTTTGTGVNASVDGTFTAGALTATAFVGTGTGCVVGDILTAQGGSVQPGAAAVIPATFRVTAVGGGVIQSGGIVVQTSGEYGTPPTNPVTTTGTGTCAGAQVNISNMTNRGGSLGLKGLRFLAAAPDVSLVKAQFNAAQRTTAWQNLSANYTGDNNWKYIADLTGVSHSIFQNITWINNVTKITQNLAGFTVREQNTLLGHFEHTWDNVHVKQGWQLGWNYKLIDSPGFQGLRWRHSSFGAGGTAWLMENTSLGPTTYIELIWDDCFHQSLQFLDLKQARNVRIENSNVRAGTTRLSSPPSTTTEIVLRNVHASFLRNNYFSAISPATPNITFVEFTEASSFITTSGNFFANGPNLNVTAYRASADTSAIHQSDDSVGVSIPAPVADSAQAGKNFWALKVPPGRLASWGRAVTAGVPSEFARPVDGGGSPGSGGIGLQRWYAPARSAADVLATPSANTCYAVPVYLPNQVSVRGLAYRISTASAGNWAARMGIYTDLGGDDVPMGPGALVPNSDTGNIAQTSATTGANTIQVNPDPDAGGPLEPACAPGEVSPCGLGANVGPGWAWLAWVYNGGSSPVLATVGAAIGALSSQALGSAAQLTAITGTRPAVSRACPYTGTEAMPTTFGAATLDAVNAPVIAFKAN